jgi:hypothetical protein
MIINSMLFYLPKEEIKEHGALLWARGDTLYINLQFPLFLWALVEAGKAIKVWRFLRRILDKALRLFISRKAEKA